jgi:hypothetical protein
MDDHSALFVDHEEDCDFTCSTYWRGLISGRSYACYHEGALPTAEFFRAAEQRELETVNHTGATNQ